MFGTSAEDTFKKGSLILKRRVIVLSQNEPTGAADDVPFARETVDVDVASVPKVERRALRDVDGAFVFAPGLRIVPSVDELSALNVEQTAGGHRHDEIHVSVGGVEVVLSCDAERSGTVDRHDAGAAAQRFINGFVRAGIRSASSGEFQNASFIDRERHGLRLLRNDIIVNQRRAVVDRDLRQRKTRIPGGRSRRIHYDFTASNDCRAGIRDAASDRRDGIRPVVEKERAAVGDLHSDRCRAFEVVPGVRGRECFAGRSEELDRRVGTGGLLGVERVERKARGVRAAHVKRKRGSVRDSEFVECDCTSESQVRTAGDFYCAGDVWNIEDLDRSLLDVKRSRDRDGLTKAAELICVEDQRFVGVDVDYRVRADVSVRAVADLKRSVGDLDISSGEKCTGEDLRAGAVFADRNILSAGECTGEFRRLLRTVY